MVIRNNEVHIITMLLSRKKDAPILDYRIWPAMLNSKLQTLLHFEFRKGGTANKNEADIFLPLQNYSHTHDSTLLYRVISKTAPCQKFDVLSIMA